MRKRRSVEDRFWDKVHKTESCWNWTANTTYKGYGQIFIEKINKKPFFKSTHRLSWELHNGPILNNLCVLHKCDNRACVNPNHLYLGTNQDNANDRQVRQRSKNVKGENHWYAVLLPEIINEIKFRYKNENISQTKLSKEYGVTQGHISRIIREVTWRHLD